MNPDDLDALLPSGLPGADAPKGDKSEFAGWLKAVKAVLKEAPVIHVKDVSPKTIELDSLTFLTDLAEHPDETVVNTMHVLKSKTKKLTPKQKVEQFALMYGAGPLAFKDVVGGQSLMQDAAKAQSPADKTQAVLQDLNEALKDMTYLTGKAKSPVPNLQNLPKPSTPGGLKAFSEEFHARLTTDTRTRQFLPVEGNGPSYQMFPPAGALWRMDTPELEAADITLAGVTALLYAGFYVEAFE